MSGFYVLDEHRNPVEVGDALAWARWYEEANRGVALDRVGPFRVSTVFLGLDHSFGRGKPLLFETMVFDEGAKHPLRDVAMQRYTTWAEAAEGHAAMVKRFEAVATARAR